MFACKRYLFHAIIPATLVFFLHLPKSVTVHIHLHLVTTLQVNVIWVHHICTTTRQRTVIKKSKAVVYHGKGLAAELYPVWSISIFQKNKPRKKINLRVQHTDLGVGGVQGSRCPRLFGTWPPGPLFLQLPLCSPECCQVCCPTWHAPHHGSNPLWRSPPPQSSLDCLAHLETNINPSHNSYTSQPPPPPTSR